MDPVSAMAALFTDISTVLTNISTVITAVITEITGNPVLLLFVVLVPVISFGIGILARLLRVGRY